MDAEILHGIKVIHWQMAVQIAIGTAILISVMTNSIRR